MPNHEESYSEKLKKEIEEAHARVEYTYTAHHKMKDRYLFYDKAIRLTQVVLMAISTCGFLATLFTNKVTLSWIGGITSALSLGLTLCFMEFRFNDEAQKHKRAADDLWEIKTDYISLITDMAILEGKDIAAKRDELKARVSEINRSYPGTDRRSYKKARKALKDNQEQSFDKGEAEQFSPK